MRELAELYEEDNRLDEARQLLEQAVVRAPLAAANHGCLADLLWQQGEHEAAVERLKHALRLDPGYEWAWRRLSEFARHLEQPDEAVALARELTEKRPHEARSWLMLAKMLTPRAGDEYVAALRQATTVYPRCFEALDLQADFLAKAGRFDEARAACRPPVDEQPLFLRGRAAWIEAERGNVPQAVAQMEDLLQEDPNYYWGWTKVAEWRERLGDLPGYLAAAEEMVRLAPEDPTALTYRGEARLRTDERTAGLEDLRAAVAAAPDYAFASMTLFDAQLADDDIDGARHTLMLMEEHIGGEYVATRAAKLAAKCDEEEQAVECLRRLCDHVFQATWPLDEAVKALRQAGWGGRVDEVLGEVVRQEEFPPHAALLWSRTWDEGDDEEELEERLAALRRARALAEVPQDFDDVLAELLARAGRYDEARAACAPADLPEVPVNLRGRAAWVEKQRGDLDRALALMRALLEEHPDYYWGWTQLVEWHEQRKELAESLAAAEQLVRLAPDHAPAFGNRGEARRLTGDLAGAKADFARAVELDPAYFFGSLSLFDRQLADGELDAAEETLDVARQHAAAVDVLFKEIQLAAKRQERDEALQLFRLACEQCDGSRWHFDEALQALTGAGCGEDAERVLRESVGGEEGNPLAGEILAQRRAARGAWFSDKELESLAAEGEAGRAVLIEYAVALGRAKQQPCLLALLRQHGDLLRADGHGWGQMGHALALTDKDADELIVDWQRDWEQQADAEPWMLLNLAVSLRAVGRAEEANRASACAVTLDADYTTPYHHVWLALDDALAGRTEAARQRLAGVQPAALDGWHKFFAALADAVLLVQAERGRAFREARQLLARAAADSAAVTHDRCLKKTYRRCVRHIGRTCGLAARAWAGWRCVRPVLPKEKKA